MKWFLVAAKLTGANLTGAVLVGTNLIDAELDNCRIYGVSAWNVKLDGAKQTNLVLTSENEPEITVDNLKVAQFIYLLLNNAEIREVIATIGRKAVLILGRFTPKRKPVLDAIRDELRRRDYLPIMFDFEKPEGRNFTETVSTLAHMARFVIADALVVLQELERIVPKLPSVPVQPLLEQGEKKNPIVRDFEDYPWFLEMYRYKDLTDVCASLQEKIIGPAETKARQIEERRKSREQED